MSTPASSRFEPWTKYLDVALVRHACGAYAYITDKIVLDADGSPFAYHPDNLGRDDLRFASWPSGKEDWRLILLRPRGPETALRSKRRTGGGLFPIDDNTAIANRERDRSSHVCEQRGLVFPTDFLNIEGVGGFGDLAMVRNVAT